MKTQMKLFTYMTKPFVLFVLLFALGVGQMWGYYLPGNIIESRGKVDDNNMGDDGKITFYAVPAGTYWCKLTDGTNWYNNVDGYSDGDGFSYEVESTGDKNIIITLTKTKNLYVEVKSGNSVYFTTFDPTYHIRFNFGGVGWQWRELTNNGDGTYSYIAQYNADKNAANGYRYRMFSSDDASDDGSKWGGIESVTVTPSTLATGDLSVFTYKPSDNSLSIRKCNTVSATSHIYFDNTETGWSNTYKYLIIGRASKDGNANYLGTYTMSPVEHTNLWYHEYTGGTWSDAEYYAVGGRADKYDTGSESRSVIPSKFDSYTAPYLLNYNFSNTVNYVITPSSNSNGSSISIADRNTVASGMNNELTIRYSVSRDGGTTYSELNEGITPATISISTYYFVDGTYNSVTATGTQSVPVDQSTTYSKSVNAGYTAETSLSYSLMNSGYEFIGWFDAASGGNELSSPYYPTEGKTIYARFKEKRFSVAFADDGNGTVTAPNSTPQTVGQVTGIDINASAEFGYQFNIWSSSTGGSFDAAGTASTKFYPTAATTVTANFARRYAYIEANFQVYDATRSSRTPVGNVSWKNDSRAIEMAYDGTNRRYYLHTYSTPAQLAERLNDADAYFYIKTTSSSSSTFTDVVSYYADGISNQSLSSAGSANQKDVTTSSSANSFKFTGSDNGYVILYFDGTHVWYELEYGVTYDGNDNTGGIVPVDNDYYASEATVTVKADPDSWAKTGYTFGGWTTADGGSGTKYDAGETFAISANTTLYAKWTQTVTLDKNGGSKDGSVDVIFHGTSTSSLSVAERAGYSVEAYYAEPGCTNKVLTDNGNLVGYSGYVEDSKWVYSNATTLYTNWTANPYTVTLNNLEASTAGTASVNVTYDAITGLTLPIEKPEKAHYDFGGYYVSNDGGETLTNIQLIDANGNWKKGVSGYTGTSEDNATWVYAGDITLYAKWTEHEYAVTLAISPAGTGTTSPASSTTAKYVTASGDITATPSTGYSFREWGFSETGTGNYDVYVSDGSSYSSTDATIRIKAQRDGTLTANFTPNTYTVRFENLGADKGHKGSLDTTVTFNDTIHMKGRIEVPSKAHYEFGGYYISTDKGATLTNIQIIDANGNWNKNVSGYTGEKDGVASWVCAADTVLYAKWTETAYTITPSVSPAGAGTVNTVTDAHLITPSSTITATPVNAAWVFDRWEYGEHVGCASGCSTNSVTVTSDMNSTITAHFKPRYELVGCIWDNSGNGGMPGWSYDGTEEFTVNSFTALGTGEGTGVDLSYSCTLWANTTYKFEVHDRVTGNHGKYYAAGQYLNDGEHALLNQKNNDVPLAAIGEGTYTFRITNMTYDGTTDDYFPTITVERPHQILIGRRRVDIDGDEHDDDLGGTVALSEQTAPDTWTPISNEAWVSYGHSVKYDASPVSGYSLAWYTESDYSSLFTTDSYWFHSASATGKGYAQFTETPTTVTLANDGHGHVEIGSGNTVTQTTVGVTTTRELTAVPNDGYMFSSWNKSGDDIEITSTSTNPTTLSGKGAGAASGQEVQANFTYRWALSAESVGWGSEEFTIENILTDGSGNTIGYVDINLAANTNYQFTIKDKLNDDIYKIGGTSVLYMDKNNCSNWTFGTGGDRSNCGITTAGKGSYRFSWNPSTYKLSVTYPAAQLISCGAATENGGTGGSITAIKDEANNDYSNGQYISEGNTITFTATPTDGYEFVGWFSNNKYNAAPVTTENPWDFPVAEPVNVYALFAEENVYYFDGNNGTSTDWTTPTNWTRKVVPTTSSHSVRILKPVTVSTGTKVHVANVDIVTGGSFTPAGGSALTASGQLNIADGGMLIVAGSVKKVADASAMSTKTPTDYDDLNIGSTLANGNGALVIGSHDGTNKAHVAFATKAKKDDAGHNVNQFIGTPFNDENYIFYNYYGTKIYEFKAARDGNKGANNEWQRLPNDGDMTPFWGYNILTSQTTSPTLWMQGTLNSSANHVTNLYYKTGDTQTENMLANSWVSPIDITKFKDSDFSANVEQTIYIYNAGTVADEETAGEGRVDASLPGQWIVLPINSMPWTSPTVTVIPSMQAFSVYVTAASQTLTMDYNRLVYNPAVNGAATIVPNRAPRRYTEEEAPAVLKIRVSGESGYSDQIVLLSREDFTFGYDNGWDGRKIMGDDAAPQLYTITQDGKMSIDCTPLIEGTLVGFNPGEADPFYTIRFDYDGDETLYLNDLQMQLSTPIDAEHTYSFSAYANDAESRFVISATPISQTATGIDRTETVSELRKIIIHDHLYIIRQGRIYTAHGQLVK